MVLSSFHLAEGKAKEGQAGRKREREERRRQGRGGEREERGGEEMQGRGAEGIANTEEGCGGGTGYERSPQKHLRSAVPRKRRTGISPAVCPSTLIRRERKREKVQIESLPKT